MALVIATTSFATSAFASPLNISLYSAKSTEIAFISPKTATKAGKVILRVAPKVADKLVKKYGTKIIKIIPVAGTAITVIEISLDFYNIVQQELSKDVQSAA